MDQLSLVETSAATIYQAKQLRSSVNNKTLMPEWMTAIRWRILEAVGRYRLLDTSQVERLTNANALRARRNLLLLSKTGFLARFERPAFALHLRRHSPIYGLASRGARLLAHESGKPLSSFRIYTDVPTYQTAEHTIELNDLRIACDHSAPSAGCSIEKWQHEPSLVKRGVLLRPDAFAVVKNKDGHPGYFFVETDRGTEHMSQQWRPKFKRYPAMFASGKFHDVFEVSDPALIFRVLVTTPDQRRAAVIQEAISREVAEVHRLLFLIAPIDAVINCDNVFTSPIWWRGGYVQPQTLI